MTGRKAFSLGVAAFLASLAPNAMAQPSALASAYQDLGSVSMAVEVPLATSVATTRETADQPITWRIYAERDELRLKLRVTNESEELLFVDQGKLRQAIGARVSQGDALPVAMRWIENELYDERLPVVVAGEQIALGSKTFVVWTIGLKRQDGLPYLPGAYTIAIEIANIRASLITSSGDVWKGRVPESGTRRFVVRVELPKSKEEAALRYRLEADDKAVRDEFADALNAYSLAAEVNPDDFSSVFGMAHMYRNLGRYREAIPLYAKVLAQHPSDQRLASLLALAYVGAGEEAQAMDVLRAAGTPTSDIPTKMQELRDGVGPKR